MNKQLKRLIPFFVLIVLILIVYLTNVHNYLSLENLRLKETELRAFVKEHPFLSPLVYIVIYVVSVALVIPDSTILSLLAGMVFPLPLAILYAVFSETVGALIFFSIFHGTFGKGLIQRERPFLHKLRKKFQNHEAVYLLFLRVSHVFPFWLTNLSAAYFRVPYWTFLWTTWVGVLPLTYLLADAGRSLTKAFASDAPVSLSTIFTPQLKISLLLVSLIAFVPIVYKKLKELKK